MTQVTTPDNIPSPDLTDQYALTQDMANLADGTQKALIKRANLYLGTSAQRTAFTTAPEGTHWQDTNSTKLEYIRKSGVWEPTTVDSGWLPLTLNSGFKAASATRVPACRRIGQVVYFRGAVSPLSGNFTTASYQVVASLPSAIQDTPEVGVFVATAAPGSAATFVSLSGRNVQVTPSGTPGWIDLANFFYVVG